MAIMENAPIRQNHSLKKYTWKQGFPDQQTEWNTYFNWYTEAPQRLQDSRIALLKDSLQKANKKKKIQDTRGTWNKDLKTNVTLTIPLSLLPEYSPSTNPLPE